LLSFFTNHAAKLLGAVRVQNIVDYLNVISYYRTMNKLRSLVLAAFLALPLASFAQVGISINIAPPVMPVYEQPPCPVEGYIWTPGY